MNNNNNNNNNNNIWWLIILVGLILIFFNFNFGNFSTLQNCISIEPTNIDNYGNLNFISDSISCNKGTTENVYGILCNNPSLFIFDFKSSCLNKISSLDIKENYKGVNIYCISEGETFCSFCSSNDKYVIQTSLDLTIAHKYIDHYYSCTNTVNTSNQRNFFIDFIDYINGKNVNSTSYTLWWVLGIGIVLLTLITKQYWLLIIIPIVIFIALAGGLSI